MARIGGSNRIQRKGTDGSSAHPMAWVFGGDLGNIHGSGPMVGDPCDDLTGRIAKIKPRAPFWR
jgi:hypothetical protein